MWAQSMAQAGHIEWLRTLPGNTAKQAGRVVESRARRVQGSIAALQLVPGVCCTPIVAGSSYIQAVTFTPSGPDVRAVVTFRCRWRYRSGRLSALGQATTRPLVDPTEPCCPYRFFLKKQSPV